MAIINKEQDQQQPKSPKKSNSQTQKPKPHKPISPPISTPTKTTDLGHNPIKPHPQNQPRHRRSQPTDPPRHHLITLISPCLSNSTYHAGQRRRRESVETLAVFVLASNHFHKCFSVNAGVWVRKENWVKRKIISVDRKICPLTL